MRRALPVVVVLGDLLLDIVVRSAGALVRATDVPGVIELRQGGSAASTARWLARLGCETRFITSVGDDAIGAALVAEVERDGVVVHAVPVAAGRSGRIGVVLEPTGERSFVADRAAADLLEPAALRPDWFGGAALLHLPAYSLLSEPLGSAALRACNLARSAGARVSLDLASAGPLLAGGRDRALALVRAVAPDLLFANEMEAHALGGSAAGLRALAPVVVVKRGSSGALVLFGGEAEVAVPTERLATADTTGAGDAFDAGFIAAWLADGAAEDAAVLRRAAEAGVAAARRHLMEPRVELDLGG